MLEDVWKLSLCEDKFFWKLIFQIFEIKFFLLFIFNIIWKRGRGGEGLVFARAVLIYFFIYRWIEVYWDGRKEGKWGTLIKFFKSAKTEIERANNTQISKILVSSAFFLSLVFYSYWIFVSTTWSYVSTQLKWRQQNSGKIIRRSQNKLAK